MNCRVCVNLECTREKGTYRLSCLRYHKEIGSFHVLPDLVRPLGICDGKQSCPLSKRQLAVLRRIAEGDTYKEAARTLGVKDQTVKNHLAQMAKRLGMDGARANRMVYLAAVNQWI
jgi:ATP/maltotriose-dependent transcriptional regulator MalT